MPYRMQPNPAESVAPAAVLAQNVGAGDGLKVGATVGLEETVGASVGLKLGVIVGRGDRVGEGEGGGVGSALGLRGHAHPAQSQL